MSILIDAKHLADYISGLEGFKVYEKERQPVYNHIGATVTDCILQAGLNYRNVVKPRVISVLREYSNFNTTTKFCQLISDFGIESVIRWNHPVKIERVFGLLDLLLTNEIEYESELKHWICAKGSEQELLEINGIGFKTVDYLKGLLSVDCVAVDRHIYSFVSDAGIDYTKYQEVKYIVEKAADFLKLRRSVLDYSIWNFKSATQSESSNNSTQYNLFKEPNISL